MPTFNAQIALPAGVDIADVAEAIRGLAGVEGVQMAEKTVIVATDNLGVRTYLARHAGGAFTCTLSNGTRASLGYAGVLNDEYGVRIRLDNTRTAEEALAVIREAGSRAYTYEML